MQTHLLNRQKRRKVKSKNPSATGFRPLKNKINIFRKNIFIKKSRSPNYLTNNLIIIVPKIMIVEIDDSIEELYKNHIFLQCLYE